VSWAEQFELAGGFGSEFRPEIGEGSGGDAGEFLGFDFVEAAAIDAAFAAEFAAGEVAGPLMICLRRSSCSASEIKFLARSASSSCNRS
jgi:hypothetical protein